MAQDRRMNRFPEELIRQMEQEFDRSEEILRRFFHSITAPERYWEPHADVYETREAVRVKVELAGVRSESIQVELAGDGKSLAIRGVREDERAEAIDRILFHQMEIYLGPFERVLSLPAGVHVDRDNLTATYRDGFLMVTLPKRSHPPRQTQVRVSPE
jgi:HSP20 family protein